MKDDILAYNNTLGGEDALICVLLMHQIMTYLPQASSRVWHGHPVWFLEGNPVVGYSKQKKGICLLFWSGQSFDESDLKPEGKFKAAQIYYTGKEQINTSDLKRRLQKATTIQWDYKNIVKRRGVLERLV